MGLKVSTELSFPEKQNVSQQNSQLLDAREHGGQHRLDFSRRTRADHRVSLSLELLCNILQQTNTRSQTCDGKGEPDIVVGSSEAYLPLPVGAVDQDEALWERRVRQQNLVQLIVHGFPQDLHTQNKHAEEINPLVVTHLLSR